MEIAQNTLKKNHVYDYVVIGSGLSGLLIAKNLNRISNNVLLVESGDFPGGLNRAIKTPAGPQNNGLRFIPESDLAKKSLEFLSLTLDRPIQFSVDEAPPQHFEGGGLKPFVGFGNTPPAFYEEINHFTAHSRLTLHEPVYRWVEDLFSSFQGDFSPRSYVTKFQIEDGLVSQITLNGQKTVSAQNVIYTGPVKALKTLLPEGTLSAKALQKLTKNSYWTAVCLDLLHEVPVTDTKSIHLLNGTTIDELGPCAGQFQEPIDINGQLRQYSQWISFVDDEAAEDTEVIGTALKKMKRQIQRVYPACLEHLQFERILVVNSYAGNGDLKLSGNMTLPNVKNLWIGSATMNRQTNLLAALLQAEIVVSALGCHPLGAQVETAADPTQEDSTVDMDAHP